MVWISCQDWNWYHWISSNYHYWDSPSKCQLSVVATKLLRFAYIMHGPTLHCCISHGPRMPIHLNFNYYELTTLQRDVYSQADAATAAQTNSHKKLFISPGSVEVKKPWSLQLEYETLHYVSNLPWLIGPLKTKAPMPYPLNALPDCTQFVLNKSLTRFFVKALISVSHANLVEWF